MSATPEQPSTGDQTRAQWLRRASQRLANEVQRDAAILLAHALGIERAQLAASLEEPLSLAAGTRFMALIERRACGEPLAYLVGRKEFWSLDLHVTPAALVPRPETELIVERALALCTSAAIEALDLGTGSGAVALALATERPGWRITASDRSEAALAVARANASALGCGQVEFALGQWLAAIEPPRMFDLIVSNPPYVAADDPALQSDGLRYEPIEALVAASDGLGDLQEIIAQAPHFLRPGGWVVLEHGSAQGDEVRKLLVARGFVHVRSHFDLAGHERVSEGAWH